MVDRDSAQHTFLYLHKTVLKKKYSCILLELFMFAVATFYIRRILLTIMLN